MGDPSGSPSVWQKGTLLGYGVHSWLLWRPPADRWAVASSLPEQKTYLQKDLTGSRGRGPLLAAELPVATPGSLLLTPVKVSREVRVLNMPSLEVLTALSWGSLLWLPVFGELTMLSPPNGTL